MRDGDRFGAAVEFDKTPLNPFDTLNTVFSTEKIYFDLNKAYLRSESFVLLDELARWLVKFQRVKLEVRGHTDIAGTEEYNQRLSELRAASVIAALIERGVAPARLRSRGFGASDPLAPNDTEENRQRNRRTEFVIIAR